MSLTKEEIDALLNGVDMSKNGECNVKSIKYGNIMDSPNLVSQFVNKQMHSDNDFKILHEQIIVSNSGCSLFLSYTYEGELQ